MAYQVDGFAANQPTVFTPYISSPPSGDAKSLCDLGCPHRLIPLEAAFSERARCTDSSEDVRRCGDWLVPNRIIRFEPASFERGLPGVRGTQQPRTLPAEGSALAGGVEATTRAVS
jgi:hypothetical protein